MLAANEEAYEEYFKWRDDPEEEKRFEEVKTAIKSIHNQHDISTCAPNTRNASIILLCIVAPLLSFQASKETSITSGWMQDANF